MSNQIRVALIAHPSDAKPLGQETKVWLDSIERNLALRVQQLTGCLVNVTQFFPSNTDFELELADVQPFDFVLPVYSSHFYHSEACIRVTQQIQELGSHAQTATFALFRNPLDEESLPRAIQLHERFYFFKRDLERDRLQYFTPGNPDTERLFWGKIDDCANEIFAIWSSWYTEMANAQRDEKVEPVTVFLAECSADMTLYRDLLKRDLTDKGVVVLPERTLPTQISELNATLKQLMKRCDFSIHMLGIDYGHIPEGSNRSTIEIQNDIAEEILTKEDKKRYLWVPEGIVSSDERQRILLDDAKTSMKAVGSADVVVGVIEVFKDVVHDAVHKIEYFKNKQQQALDDTSYVPQLYVICDYLDRDFWNREKANIESIGCTLLFSAFEPNEQQIRKLHMSHLRECDGILFYFNEGNEKWLQTRLLEIQRVKAYGREKSPFAAALAFGSKRVDALSRMVLDPQYQLFNFSEALPIADLAIWIRNWKLN